MIYALTHGNYGDDPIRQVKFTTGNNVDFYYGIGACNIKNVENNGNKKVVLFTERGDYYDIADSIFDQILVIHPYTDTWMNEKNKTNKWKYVYIPIPESVAQVEISFDAKIYDVCYAGYGFSGNLIPLVLEPIFKHRYAYVSMSKEDPRVTHKNVSYSEKLNALRQSKIAIVHNILWENPANSGSVHLRNYINNNTSHAMKNFGWSDGKTFRHYYPELKTRIFEAAAAGCIPLVMRDEFMTIEKYFVPNEDFIYFEQGKLPEVLEEVIINYDKYKHIAISAKNKVNQYTDTNFSKTFLDA